MLLDVAPDLLDMGLCVAAITVRGLDNSRTPPELIAYRRQTGQRLAAFWKNRSVTAHPAVREYHRVHEQVGAPGQPPAPEKLITYLRRQRDLTAAGAVVDCYNLVSVKTLLSIGAHDLAKLAIPVTFRRATLKDTFVPLGQGAEQSLPGEYAYIDRQDRIICRLDVLQCEYSKVTAESCDVVFFLQGNRCLPATILLKGAWLLAEMIETFCGGRAELVAFFEAARDGPTRWGKPPVSLDTFKQMDLRVGTVLNAERHPNLSDLAVVTVQLDGTVEALAPGISVEAEPVGRRVVVARDLYPLSLGGKQFTAYLMGAHQGPRSSVLQVDTAIPDGHRLY